MRSNLNNLKQILKFRSFFTAHVQEKFKFGGAWPHQNKIKQKSDVKINIEKANELTSLVFVFCACVEAPSLPGPGNGLGRVLGLLK